MKALVFCLVILSPMFATPISQHINEQDMWWCSGCGVAYPAGQKVCLNKNCPLFRQKR